MSTMPDFAAMSHEDLVAKCCQMHQLLNTPSVDSFLEGTRIEIAHQIDRWGTVHDRAKQPQDWFWLLGYLGGKALRAHVDGDIEKALHHTISTAAVLGNWYTHILYGGQFTPGASDLQKFLADQFGANYAEHRSKGTAA